ncbi:acyl carrier protein [Bacillus siamensis]|uniref:acyl carrier protein n=1 Tax=Bacillus siamensis TaxID=659243 RepID=UPI000648516B|nr:acyl carrier protein [Bacillus siamensis]MDU0814649.1 acyl carrier protein [Bacillus siamensis]
MKKEDIFSILVHHTREIVPELEQHHFQWDDRLADLGANSVDRAEIIMETLEALSLQIPRIELSEARNLGGLAEILYEKMQHA